MSDPEERDDEAVLAAFLVELLDDRTRNKLRDVAWYQARYPGYEEAIAKEFLRADDDAAPPEHETSSLPEDLSDRFRVDGELGRGGMGIVMRAHEHNLDRLLAIKVMRNHTDDAARFLEEARVTAQLAHPGVVPVHELGVGAEGTPYFTMPLVRGRTFAAVIREAHEQGGDWPRTASVLQRVCETVAFAHSKGVLHRDLKPQNIMVGRYGEIYVMDWGLARAGSDSAIEDAADRHSATTCPTSSANDDSLLVSPRADSDITWTLQGTVLGTPAYMAPEQARGAADVDGRADVYSIGAMLYHTLTGREPYAESSNNKSSRAMLDMLVAGPPQSLTELRPDAPAELIAICQRAMARDREQRYQSVEELRDELGNFLEGRVVRTYEQGAWPTLRKWVRRNPLAAGASGFAIAALVVGLAVSWFLLARAEEEAIRANLNFDKSVLAVEAMLAKVGDEMLDGVPQATPVRRELMAEANRLFETFRLERPNDLTLLQRVAAGTDHMAELYLRMGDTNEARAAITRSADLWRHLRSLDGGTGKFDILLACNRQASAVEYMSHGKYEHASKDLDRARLLIDPLVDQATSVHDLDTCAAIYETLALVALRTKRHKDIGPLAQRSIELAKRLVAQHGDAYQFRIARPYSLLAGICATNRDMSGAAAHFKEAVIASRAAVAAQPHSPNAQASVILACRNLSEIARKLGDRPRCIRLLEEALAHARAGAADYPLQVRARSRLASCLERRTILAWEDRDYPLAERLSNEALTHILAALELDPEDLNVCKTACQVRRRIYLSLSLSGKFEEALTNAQELAAVASHQPKSRLEAAMQFSALSRKFAAADPTDTKSANLRAAAIASAFELLQKLHQNQALRSTSLKDARLDPIRDEPRFRTLAAAVAARETRQSR